MDTDLSLVEAARKMDQEALVKIFDLYASPLYKYALRLCGDPILADHIVGDVFAKLLEQFAAGKGPTSHLRPYLYETAYHLIIDESRSSYHNAPLDVLTWSRPEVDAASQAMEDQILFELIMHAIQHDLTDDQRHVIILRFLEEFSLRETAEILDKDVGLVKVIQSRAVAKLRNVFANHEIRSAVSLPRTRKLSEL
jgi:RNA polymerase sigma-70 factor (ECF subfamily)